MEYHLCKALNGNVSESFGRQYNRDILLYAKLNLKAMKHSYKTFFQKFFYVMHASYVTENLVY